MKSFPSLPVLSAVALALGFSGAQAQQSSTPPASPAPGVQTAPVIPPAAPSPASPSSSNSAANPPSAAMPSTGAESSSGQRAGEPGVQGDMPGYGRGRAAMRRYGPGAMGPGMMGGQGQGYEGYGPGMMGGYGMGPGRTNGYGMGPGMMGGYGMGPGMMGGYGMGPGMMGGYGMGPGMMGGYGMGPGMMGGYGMGPGMMGGFGGWALSSLDLDESQRKRLRAVQDEQRRQQWALMGQVHDEMAKLRDAWSPDSGTRDRAAILAASKRIAELHQQQLEGRLDAFDQVERILTPEQREQLRSEWGGQRGRGMR